VYRGDVLTSFFAGTRADNLQELTGLQRLAITGACLRPSAVQQLLQALGHCAALTSLVLSGNDLCLLPEKGWQRVTGLKVGRTGQLKKTGCGCYQWQVKGA
jgi:hypothetical protein